jgi:hypothetical protein
MFRGGRTRPVALGRRRWSKRKSRRWWIRGVLEAWWDHLGAASLRLRWPYSVQAGYVQSLLIFGTKPKLHTPVTIFEAGHVHVLAHSMMTYAMSSFAVRNRKDAWMGSEAKRDIKFAWRKSGILFCQSKMPLFRLNETGAIGCNERCTPPTNERRIPLPSHPSHLMN